MDGSEAKEEGWAEGLEEEALDGRRRAVLLVGAFIGARLHQGVIGQTTTRERDRRRETR